MLQARESPTPQFARTLQGLVDRFLPGASAMEVCRRIGCYHNTMYRFLRGTQVPQRTNVLHLARALGATKQEEALLLAHAGYRTLDDPRFVAIETWLYGLGPEEQDRVLSIISGKVPKKTPTPKLPPGAGWLASQNGPTP